MINTIKNKKQFPELLYSLLELASSSNSTSSAAAVTWLPHGYAFKILDETEFMTVAVPMFFKQTKIRSFYRQLNLWGYKRVSSGIDAGAWYNPYFLRGHPERMKEMTRVKIKGNARFVDMKNEDPDFYSMPPLPIVAAGGSVAADDKKSSSQGAIVGGLPRTTKSRSVSEGLEQPTEKPSVTSDDAAAAAALESRLMDSQQRQAMTTLMKGPIPQVSITPPMLWRGFDSHGNINHCLPHQQQPVRAISISSCSTNNNGSLSRRQSYPSTSSTGMFSQEVMMNNRHHILHPQTTNMGMTPSSSYNNGHNGVLLPGQYQQSQSPNQVMNMNSSIMMNSSPSSSPIPSSLIGRADFNLANLPSMPFSTTGSGSSSSSSSTSDLEPLQYDNHDDDDVVSIEDDEFAQYIDTVIQKL